MNNNPRYFTVGLFVVFSASILVSVWLWFSASNHKDYNLYVAIFHEPVDGITNNSVVKYNGVEVGHVSNVELDPNNPRNIIIQLSVLQNVAINTDTFAVMKSQGLTGISYIALNLTKKTPNSQTLTPHNQPPYPEIPTHTSLFYSLSEQAQSVTTNIQDVSGQMKILLNAQNLDHFSTIMANLDKTTAAIANHAQQIGDSIDSVSELLNNVKQKTSDLDNIVKNINNLTQSLSTTTHNVNGLLTEMQTGTLQNVNTILLPNLNSTITHMNHSSYELEQLLNTLNQNPSALVRGQAPAKLGPGE